MMEFLIEQLNIEREKVKKLFEKTIVLSIVRALLKSAAEDESYYSEDVKEFAKKLLSDIDEELKGLE